MTQVHRRTFESGLGAWLARWTLASARGRRGVFVGSVLLFVGSLLLTATNLGVRSETEALFPDDLPFRVRDARFLEAFPFLHENIVLVIEGPSAEATRTATLEFADRLRRESSLFPRVELAEDPFFERNGLLYLDTEELDAVADRLAGLQPLLMALAEDESLRGLMDQTRGALEAVREDRVDEIEIVPVLRRIADAIRATPVEPVDDSPATWLDWSGLVDLGDVGGNPLRRVIRIQPALDYGSMSAAREAILRLQALVEEIGLSGANGYRVRMTGDIVLNFDEMSLLQTQVARAGVLSFLVVAVLLHLALRSTRLVLATVLSLIFGLALTAGFATLAIGHLNMISVAFAVLFIGLGVDFGIHLCMRFRELRSKGVAPETAIEESARGVGSSLMLCAVTTAVGFFAFVPTEFIGVAELGVIAGVGMFIGVGASFTIIPAIVVGEGDRATAPPSDASRDSVTLRLPTWPIVHPGPVVIGAAISMVGALSLLPELRFDQNPLNVRDPNAPSVRVYRDLLADSEHSPWTLEYLAADEHEAALRATEFRALPEVASVRVFEDFIPGDQAAKLEIIEDISYFTDRGMTRKSTSTISPSESLRAISALRDELTRLEEEGSGALDPEIVRASMDLAVALEAWLERAGRAAHGRGTGNGSARMADTAETRAMLDDLEKRLLGNFPDLMRRLDRALEASRFEAADLPAGIREARITRDGRYRVEILPAEDLASQGALDRFVLAGESVTKELAGPAIRIHASARAVVRALEQALASAVVVIVLFLLILWRRLGDVLLVIVPLAFASVSTGASMVLAGIPFNFADVIVLPLLLGIGVDSGIHMVHRVRISDEEREGVLETSTPRAVIFSAMTTIASFGTLALVPHRGMANLGQLLVIGVGWTVAANLILLPALLELRERRRKAM